MELGGLQLSLPENYGVEESKWVLRAPVQEELLDYRLQTARAKKPIAVRPNLIIHRKAVAEELDLTEHFARTVAELMQSIGGLEEIVRADLNFADGQVGKVSIVSFSPAEGVTLCQFHGYRLDKATLTSMTWTIDANDFNKDKQAECIEFLSTICPSE